MHAQMKHTLANLQDLIPTLVDMIISTTNQGLNLVDFARKCAFMHVSTQLELCLYD